MRKPVYLNINEYYTATIYSLEDLKDYVKREKLDPVLFSFHKEETGNPQLTKEIKNYINSFLKPKTKTKEVKIYTDKHFKHEANLFDYLRMGVIEVNKETKKIKICGRTRNYIPTGPKYGNGRLTVMGTFNLYGTKLYFKAFY